MQRSAQAVWTGPLRDGQGRLHSASGVLDAVPYSFATRFADRPGTNPEELIAAAHAGCYAMAVAYELQQAGVTPQRIETRAAVTLTMAGGRPSIERIALTLRAQADALDDAAFARVARQAADGCLVSRLLKVEITLDAARLPVAGEGGADDAGATASIKP